MSARGATIGFGGSVVRRMHLIVLAAIVVAVTTGVVVGRVSERGSSTAQTTHVIGCATWAAGWRSTPRSMEARPTCSSSLPVDRLAASSVGSRVYPAMNHLRLGPTEGLSGYSRYRRDMSLGWSPPSDRYLDNVRIVQGGTA